MRGGATEMKIERDSSVALYVQIAEKLAKDIAAGRYKAFERLPSEQELMDRYGVSRVTVRQAIGVLRKQGLVSAKQGKGTFVGAPIVQHELADLRGFYDALVSSGNPPQTRLLKFEPVKPEARIEALLNGSLRGDAMYLERLYLLKGHPFALARAWLPPAAKKISWDEAEANPLYSILESLLHLRVTNADVSIVARAADGDEARLLELPVKSPVLVMQRASYSPEGHGLEYSQFTVRPENYRFCLSVQGPLAITRQIQEVVPPPPAAKAERGERKRLK